MYINENRNSRYRDDDRGYDRHRGEDRYSREPELIRDRKTGLLIDEDGNVPDIPENREILAEIEEEEYQRRQGSRSKYRSGSNSRNSRYRDDEDEYEERPRASRSKYSAVGKDREEEYRPPARSSSKYHTAAEEEDRKPSRSKYDNDSKENSSSRIEKVQSVNKEIFMIDKPVDDKYHKVLLPMGYNQKRVQVSISELDSITSIRYYKNEITQEEKSMDDRTSERFGEALFKSNDGDRATVAIPTIKSFGESNEDVAMLYAGNASSIINSIHQAVKNQTSFDAKKEVLAFSTYVLDEYFTNLGKNTLLDLPAALNDLNLMQMPTKLKEIYDGLYNNVVTRNGIVQIDKKLVELLNFYIQGYSANPSLYLKSFFLSIGSLLEQLKAVKDEGLKRNLMDGLETCLLSVMSSLLSYRTEVSKKDDEPCLSAPIKELIAITVDANVLADIVKLKNDNSKEFFYIDRVYTPIIHDTIEELDRLYTIQSYGRLLLYTYDAMYMIIKTKNKGYCISNINIY